MNLLKAEARPPTEKASGPMGGLLIPPMRSRNEMEKEKNDKRDSVIKIVPPLILPVKVEDEKVEE